MDTPGPFVLDGSVTMVWAFEDEDEEFAVALLDEMPGLPAHVPSIAG